MFQQTAELPFSSYVFYTLFKCHSYDVLQRSELHVFLSCVFHTLVKCRSYVTLVKSCSYVPFRECWVWHVLQRPRSSDSGVCSNGQQGMNDVFFYLLYYCGEKFKNHKIQLFLQRNFLIPA